MNTSSSKSIYRSSLAKAVLLGLMAFCGAVAPVHGQESVGGKFTLAEDTRFESKMLKAGAYKFSIEPIGPMQSVGSIQGARQTVRMIVVPESKAGAITILFAMATRSNSALYSNKLVMTNVDNQKIMHSMYLEQQGLVLDFDWASPKVKTPVIAQSARPEPTTASSKATD